MTNNNEKYYSIQEFAEILKVTEQTVRNWIYGTPTQPAIIKHFKLGDVVRIPASEIPEAKLKL